MLENNTRTKNTTNPHPTSIPTMDVQTHQSPDGQRYSLQQLLERLLNRNKFAPAEVEQFHKLVKNVRDVKNFQVIMDKFKIGKLESEIISDNFKEGWYHFRHRVCLKIAFLYFLFVFDRRHRFVWRTRKRVLISPFPVPLLQRMKSASATPAANLD